MQGKLTVKGQLIRVMRLWILNTSKIATVSMGIMWPTKKLIELLTNHNHLLASLHPAMMNQVETSSTWKHNAYQ